LVIFLCKTNTTRYRHYMGRTRRWTTSAGASSCVIGSGAAGQP
jgi:hypothetical protein